MRFDRKIRAAFLDRDNTLVEDPGYNADPARITFMPGVIPGLRRLQNCGFTLFIVTNQSGIGRGYYSEDQFKAFQAALHTRFLNEGIEFAADYFCPHKPDENCDCRKPKPGMLLTAIEDWNIDPARSVMIGDRPKDAMAAMAAGIRGAYVPVESDSWPANAGEPAPVFSSFEAACEWACG